MATSAVLVVYNKEDQPICKLYFHYDGYIDIVGKEIINFLEEKEYVTTVPKQPDPKFCNGMEDLAAQIICHFKKQQPVGNIYLYPINQRIFTDYNYSLKVHGRTLELTVFRHNIMTKLFPK